MPESKSDDGAVWRLCQPVRGYVFLNPLTNQEMDFTSTIDAYRFHSPDSKLVSITINDRDGEHKLKFRWRDSRGNEDVQHVCYYRGVYNERLR